jgi:hypothetical protein
LFFSSGDSFYRPSRNRLVVSISRSSMFCPSTGQGHCPFRVFVVSGFVFLSQRPAVRAVPSLCSCSQHSGRPGCSSLVWSICTLISPFQLLRALGADYAHSARLSHFVFSTWWSSLCDTFFFLLCPVFVHFTLLAWSLPLVCRVLVADPS